MKDMFECNYGGRICSYQDADSRKDAVNRCTDVKLLKETLQRDDIQKTVFSAIERRIKKLRKWVKNEENN